MKRIDFCDFCKHEAGCSHICCSCGAVHWRSPLYRDESCDGEHAPFNEEGECLCSSYEPSFERATDIALSKGEGDDIFAESIDFENLPMDEDLCQILGIRMMVDEHQDPLKLDYVYDNHVELVGERTVLVSVVCPVTQTQRAQVIEWAHKLLGYCEACARIGGYCGLCSGAHWHAKQPWSRG
jgi:hypothetical protein